MEQIDGDLQSCIEKCLHCHSICLGMSMRYCLETGGTHVAPAHYRLMSACAEICRATAAVMLIGGSHQHILCGICAEICEDCAGSCEKVGNMEACVTACRDCARSCQEMAGA